MFYLSANSATSYRSIHPDFGPDFTSKVLAEARIKKGGTILDVGTGTGQLTLAMQTAAPGQYRFIALDPSPEMLAYAGAAFNLNAYNGLTHTSPVAVINTSADKTGLPDKSVDVFAIANTLHWFLCNQETELSTFKEFSRVAAENARVICITGRPKKDDFWKGLLDDLKGHPNHNPDSPFANARRRYGDKKGLAERIMENPKQLETSLQLLILSPKHAANYCKSISPYANIPEEEIDSLAKKHFESVCEGKYNLWVSDWLISAFVGNFRKDF
jgi:ubiquinone/menaquinone biosynthesis C-methylase UbiE